MNKNLLSVPLTRSSTYELKRFDYTAATLWNNLPKDICNINLDITHFKKLLKTMFFRAANMD